jgi:hypothetical protein
VRKKSLKLGSSLSPPKAAKADWVMFGCQPGELVLPQISLKSQISNEEVSLKQTWLIIALISSSPDYADQEDESSLSL